jgi:hypothetical protein
MKSRRRTSRRLRRKTQRQGGGRRLASHVNPRIYYDEFDMAEHLMDQVKEEQPNFPRFDKFKELLRYLVTSEEILKNKRFRGEVRETINEIFRLNKNYVRKNIEFSDMVRQIRVKINDLDARNVRHQIPN